jgi:hypothetical protein
VILAERLLISLALASAIAYAATPFVISLADRLQFYDQPIGYKGHTSTTDRVRRHRLPFEVGALGLNPCWIHCR